MCPWGEDPLWEIQQKCLICCEGLTARSDPQTLYEGKRRSYFAITRQSNGAADQVAHWRQSPLWNSKHEKFERRTAKKMEQSRAMDGQRQMGKLPFPNPTNKRSAPKPPQACFSQVCFLGQWADSDKRAPGCRVVPVGSHACHNLALCVVPSLAELFEVRSATWLHHLVYIVALVSI